MPVSTRSTLALWHLQDVHQGLGGDTLQAVEPCRSAHAFEPQAPRVYGARSFGLSGSWFCRRTGVCAHQSAIPAGASEPQGVGYSVVPFSCQEPTIAVMVGQSPQASALACECRRGRKFQELPQRQCPLPCQQQPHARECSQRVAITVRGSRDHISGDLQNLWGASSQGKRRWVSHSLIMRKIMPPTL